MSEIIHELTSRERLTRNIATCVCGHLKITHRELIGCTAASICPCKKYEEKTQ